MSNDAAYVPDVATVVAAADVIEAWMQREAPDEARLMFRSDLEAMAMALEAAGKLVPANRDVEYGVVEYHPNGRVYGAIAIRDNVADARAAAEVFATPGRPVTVCQRVKAGPWELIGADRG